MALSSTSSRLLQSIESRTPEAIRIEIESPKSLSLPYHLSFPLSLPLLLPSCLITKRQTAISHFIYRFFFFIQVQAEGQKKNPGQKVELYGCRCRKIIDVDLLLV